MDNKPSFDVRLKCPLVAQIIGPTQSGKTSLILNCLTHASDIFDTVFTKIYCIYSVYDPRFEKYPHVTFIQNVDPDLCSPENLDERPILVIYDDVLEQLGESTVNLVLKGSHHYNVSFFRCSNPCTIKGLNTCGQLV